MTRTLLPAGLTLALAAALGAPAALAHEKGETFSCCSVPTKEAYPGDQVDGYTIRNYVFIYADLNNDGVLRGRELRRARNRAIREERGGGGRFNR